MRTLAVLGAALACGISSLGAQRAHQFEFGAFGSFTRYDQVFNLDDQIGGGGRLGYFFSNVVSAELDAGYQSPNPKTGSASPTLAHGGASLVLTTTAPIPVLLPSSFCEPQERVLGATATT